MKGRYSEQPQKEHLSPAAAGARPPIAQSTRLFMLHAETFFCGSKSGPCLLIGRKRGATGKERGRTKNRVHLCTCLYDDQALVLFCGVEPKDRLDGIAILHGRCVGGAACCCMFLLAHVDEWLKISEGFEEGKMNTVAAGFKLTKVTLTKASVRMVWRVDQTKKQGLWGRSKHRCEQDINTY